MNDGQVERSEILPLLGAVKLSGDWTLAYCPTHSDGEKHHYKGGQSLGLSKDGVLKCFAGCAFADVMAALRANAGVEGRQRAQQPPRDRPREVGNLTVEYAYRNPATGEVLAVKGRFERPNPDGGKAEKTFRWRLPDGTYEQGIKAAGLTIAEMPLYGAELIAESPGQRVWIAEGEAATLAIRARNELVVCGAWGASQRDFGSAFDVLGDREVILWPDNDVAGRDYMAEVRRHLRGIARSVAFVSAPVPPKGDAVEYFQAGGTIEALLANVVTKPTVDVVASNRFVVRVPAESGPVAFDFAQMMRSQGSLDCELTVTHLSPVAEPEPYSQRINILSQSARASLERALGQQFGKDGINWTTVVSTAYARARTAYFDADRGTPIAELPNIEKPQFLIETILPENQPTILFGDGSGGKTYLSYAMALCVATGTNLFGFTVRRSGGVLIADYENPTGAQLRFRIRRLLAGAGWDPVIIDDLPIYYWSGMGSSLPDHAEAMLQFIARHDVRLVIVDSAAPACPGKPEDSVAAVGYFNALNRLAVTTLTIAHVNRADAETSSQRPFGSTFWHNMARRTWFVRREQEEDSDDIDIGLLCRKVNDGRKPRPLALRMHFDGDDGPVTITPQAFRDVPAFEEERPIPERIKDALLKAGNGSVAEIAEWTGLANDSVRHALERGKGTSFSVLEQGSKGRGNATTWGVIAS